MTDFVDTNSQDAPIADTTAAPKAKRDTSKKQRAHDIITTMRGAGKTETEVLKTLQDELGMTYPNSYYYTKRVFTV